MTIKLHETDAGFVPSDDRSKDYCQYITNKPAPYDENQLGLITFVESTTQVTRKNDQDADPV